MYCSLHDVNSALPLPARHQEALRRASGNQVIPALNSGLVGRGGLEPPTSRLSSARSNQLSYRPQMSVISHQNKDSAVPWHWWSLSGSNRRPSACKADALPAELRPQLPVRPVSPGPRRRSEVSSRARRLRWPHWGPRLGPSVRPALALQSRCSPS